MRKHHVKFQSDITSLHDEIWDIMEQTNFIVFCLSQTLWLLSLGVFLKNFIGLKYFFTKVTLIQTYYTRRCNAKFRVHIFTQHEEMLVLITNTFTLPTVSAMRTQNLILHFFLLTVFNTF